MSISYHVLQKWTPRSQSMNRLRREASLSLLLYKQAHSLVKTVWQNEILFVCDKHVIKISSIPKIYDKHSDNYVHNLTLKLSNGCKWMPNMQQCVVKILGFPMSSFKEQSKCPGPYHLSLMMVKAALSANHAFNFARHYAYTCPFTQLSIASNLYHTRPVTLNPLQVIHYSSINFTNCLHKTLQSLPIHPYDLWLNTYTEAKA